jgi:hypothetical protein
MSDIYFDIVRHLTALTRTRDTLSHSHKHSEFRAFVSKIRFTNIMLLLLQMFNPCN